MYVYLFAVSLSPGEETSLACVSGSVQFNCTAPLSAVWTTTGFLDNDANVRFATGIAASRTSSRIYTSDDEAAEMTSVIFVTNFSYGDQGATVMCINHLDTTQIAQTRIVVGESFGSLLVNVKNIFVAIV